jgi:hypothetical protein
VLAVLIAAAFQQWKALRTTLPDDMRRAAPRQGTPQNGLFRLISILGRIGHDAAALDNHLGQMRESGACGVVVFCGDYPLSPIRPSPTPIADTICLKTGSIFATL